MLKTKPTVLAAISHETREVRDSARHDGAAHDTVGFNGGPAASPVCVLLIAPSLDIIGGQSIQANQLLRRLTSEPTVRVRFLRVNARLPRVLRLKYLRTPINLGFYLARLMGVIRRADLVHVFTPGFSSFYLWTVPALLLARVLGKPAVLNYHDGRAEDHLANWPFARWLMHLATSVVVPSDYLVEVFTRFGLTSRRIPNIAESRKYYYRDRRRPRPVFLHNRGLAPEYNPACTLRAFAVIQQRYPDARMIIAHDGPLRQELEALTRALGLSGVQFVGSVSPTEMEALYDSADIYLMSPDADNMPLSVLECFASGLPVVSSSAGGVPNLIEHGRTGMLFAPGDHQAMATCALRLLEEPGLASRVAANARVRCEQYSWFEIGPQWIALYRRLADSINSV